jgi:hypothetical protein
MKQDRGGKGIRRAVCAGGWAHEDGKMTGSRNRKLR